MLVVDAFFQESSVVGATKSVAFRFKVFPANKFRRNVVILAFDQELDIKFSFLDLVV